MKKSENMKLDQAVRLIQEFMRDEYKITAIEEDFLLKNLEKVSLVSTFVTDEEIPIQVTADLKNCTLKTYLEDILVNESCYQDLEEFCEFALSGLTFDALTHISDAELSCYREALEKRSSKTIADFRPGDAVYVLERDGYDEVWGYTCYMYLASAGGGVIVSSFIDDYDSLEGTIAYLIKETAVNYYNTALAVYPAADCFSSAKEAKDQIAREVE